MIQTNDCEAKQEKTVGPSNAESLPKLLLAKILEQAVRDGEIEAEGKSKAELEDELQEYADNFLARLNAGKADLAVVLDVTNPALEQAREFAGEGKLEFACVFYAMWIEHWINDLIDAFVTRLGLGQDTSEQIIRETNLKGKFTWVMQIFDLPAVDPVQLRNITNITDTRNSYVHYKFKPISDFDRREEILQNTIEAAEQVVQYLQKYWSDNLFGNADETIGQFVERRFSSE